MGHTNMMSCHWCGEPQAPGHAWIDDLRYCHGDDVDVTCFMLAQYEKVDDVWTTLISDGSLES